MADFVETVGLQELLDATGVRYKNHDFERLYSQLVSEGTHEELVADIEQRVFTYFAALELPDEPTLYDRLVLSLRRKDIVASFNWDPFLVQAVTRNPQFAEMPYTLF